MKSRILWLSYGDAITRFFHIQARIRRAWQHIATLKNYDDEWIQGSQLHEFVVNHFKCLFQSGLNGEEVPPLNASYSSSEFPLQDFHDTLSRFPVDSEILSTLRSMHPFKSPGPDGFHAQLFKNNWQAVGRGGDNEIYSNHFHFISYPSGFNSCETCLNSQSA